MNSFTTSPFLWYVKTSPCKCKKKRVVLKVSEMTDDIEMARAISSVEGLRGVDSAEGDLNKRYLTVRGRFNVEDVKFQLWTDMGGHVSLVSPRKLMGPPFPLPLTYPLTYY